MELKRLFTDDDAVSPVIGVILMVAITVILAAVIASFVLGLGNSATNQTPTASFTFDYEQTDSGADFDGDGNNDKMGVVTVTHDGGNSINNKELYVRGSGFHSSWEASGSGGDPNYGSGYSPSANGFSDVDDDDRYLGSSGQWPASAGSGDDSAVVSGDFVYVGVSSDYDISVNYQAQEGQSSATLSSDTGPDA